MKFAVDRIEDNIIVLENIQTNEIIKLNIKQLPENIKEKDIIRLENNKYILDNKEKEEREKIIREKLNRLKNLKNK